MEHLVPITEITLTGKQSTYLSITRWRQPQKGKNYNTCEKGIVSASDFHFQLSSTVLLFFYSICFTTHFLHYKWIYSRVTEAGYNMTRYVAIQQEWFTACHLCDTNWHLTYSIYVCIYLVEGDNTVCEVHHICYLAITWIFLEMTCSCITCE